MHRPALSLVDGCRVGAVPYFAWISARFRWILFSCCWKFGSVLPRIGISLGTTLPAGPDGFAQAEAWITFFPASLHTNASAWQAVVKAKTREKAMCLIMALSY